VHTYFAKLFSTPALSFSDHSYFARLFRKPTPTLSYRKTLPSKPTDMRLRFSMVTSLQRQNLSHSEPPRLGLKRYPQLAVQAWNMSALLQTRIPQHLDPASDCSPITIDTANRNVGYLFNSFSMLTIS